MEVFCETKTRLLRWPSDLDPRCAGWRFTPPTPPPQVFREYLRTAARSATIFGTPAHTFVSAYEEILDPGRSRSGHVKWLNIGKISMVADDRTVRNVPWKPFDIFVIFAQGIHRSISHQFEVKCQKNIERISFYSVFDTVPSPCLKYQPYGMYKIYLLVQ